MKNTFEYLRQKYPVSDFDSQGFYNEFEEYINKIERNTYGLDIDEYTDAMSNNITNANRYIGYAREILQGELDVDQMQKELDEKSQQAFQGIEPRLDLIKKDIEQEQKEYKNAIYNITPIAPNRPDLEIYKDITNSSFGGDVIYSKESMVDNKPIYEFVKDSKPLEDSYQKAFSIVASEKDKSIFLVINDKESIPKDYMDKISLIYGAEKMSYPNDNIYQLKERGLDGRLPQNIFEDRTQLEHFIKDISNDLNLEYQNNKGFYFGDASYEKSFLSTVQDIHEKIQKDDGLKDILTKDSANYDIETLADYVRLTYAQGFDKDALDRTTAFEVVENSFENIFPFDQPAVQEKIMSVYLQKEFGFSEEYADRNATVYNDIFHDREFNCTDFRNPERIMEYYELVERKDIPYELKSVTYTMEYLKEAYPADYLKTEQGFKAFTDDISSRIDEYPRDMNGQDSSWEHKELLLGESEIVHAYFAYAKTLGQDISDKLDKTQLENRSKDTIKNILLNGYGHENGKKYWDNISKELSSKSEYVEKELNASDFSYFSQKSDIKLNGGSLYKTDPERFKDGIEWDLKRLDRDVQQHKNDKGKDELFGIYYDKSRKEAYLVVNPNINTIKPDFLNKLTEAYGGERVPNHNNMILFSAHDGKSPVIDWENGKAIKCAFQEIGVDITTEHVRQTADKSRINHPEDPANVEKRLKSTYLDMFQKTKEQLSQSNIDTRQLAAFMFNGVYAGMNYHSQDRLENLEKQMTTAKDNGFDITPQEYHIIFKNCVHKMLSAPITSKGEQTVEQNLNDYLKCFGDKNFTGRFWQNDKVNDIRQYLDRNKNVEKIFEQEFEKDANNVSKDGYKITSLSYSSLIDNSAFKLNDKNAIDKRYFDDIANAMKLKLAHDDFAVIYDNTSKDKGNLFIALNDSSPGKLKEIIDKTFNGHLQDVEYHPSGNIVEIKDVYVAGVEKFSEKIHDVYQKDKELSHQPETPNPSPNVDQQWEERNDANILVSINKDNSLESMNEKLSDCFYGKDKTNGALLYYPDKHIAFVCMDKATMGDKDFDSLIDGKKLYPQSEPSNIPYSMIAIPIMSQDAFDKLQKDFSEAVHNCEVERFDKISEKMADVRDKYEDGLLHFNFNKNHDISISRQDLEFFSQKITSGEMSPSYAKYDTPPCVVIQKETELTVFDDGTHKDILEKAGIDIDNGSFSYTVSDKDIDSIAEINSKISEVRGGFEEINKERETSPDADAPAFRT